MGRPQTPEAIAKILRREVNGGCPICGVVYLDYHHFDPPWAKHHHFNPEGMIALCATHHRQADQRKFTDEQLRSLKQHPNPELAKHGWLRNELVLIGGGLYFDCSTYLKINGRKIVWFNRDVENNLLLNIDIRDSANRKIILMQDNDWIKYDYAEIEDSKVSSSGHRLEIQAQKLGISFSLEYKSLDRTQLHELCEKLGFLPVEPPSLQDIFAPLGQFLQRLEPEDKDFILKAVGVEWKYNTTANSMAAY